MKIEKFGQNVRRLRRERRMSLVQMARSLSITHDALSKIERGERQPSFHVAVEIAAALGVGLDELLGDLPEGQKNWPCHGVDTALSTGIQCD